MVNVRFLGAAREVTGSMHLVETPAGKILIDCGMHQGRRDESRERNRKLPKEAVGADAVILTHAHIDHSGSLPTLVKAGFAGTIWATAATRDLCAWLLRDSARIQESDASWLNRKYGDDPDWKTIEPIYDENDAIAALGRFAGVAYGLPFSPLPGVTARFLDAGHILGSAQVVLDVPDGTGTRRLVFSGDLGRRGLPILRDPELPGRADYVFMESTYGNRAHGSLKEMHDDLERVVKATAEKRGKLIIPAFAVGRTQEIVYALNQLHRAGRIPDMPVFVDSPLSVHATEVFKLHPECYDQETRAFVEQNGDPFSFKSLRYIESREESMRLNDVAGPAIIVSASGMCEAGRVLHHLKNAVESDRNTILIVGFQAAHTLGRRIVERRPKVRILGVERDLFAQVVVMNAFSAHGDKNDLHDYAHAATGARRIYLIHGEPEQQEPLRDRLNGEGLDVIVPSIGDVAELD
jgi:metallo-beta-lactamase family protein